MATNVLDSRRFQCIYDSTPEETDYVSGENREGISALADQVAFYLQTVDNEADESRIQQFIKKVGLVNNQFKEADQGTPFAASLASINLLMDLRKNLGADYGTLIADPFTLELKGLSEEANIENKVEVATKLYNFMEQVLTPALQNAKLHEEVEVLRSFVDQCSELYDKVKSVDSKGKLLESHNTMIHTFNAKLQKFGDLFDNISNYSDGKITELDQSAKREKVVRALTPFVDDFIKYVDTGVYTTEEKCKIYEGLVKIEASFDSVGAKDEISPLIEKLNKKLGIPEGMRSSFPIDLAARGPVRPRDLYAFQKDVLIPYLGTVQTSKEVEGVTSLAEACGTLAASMSSADTRGLLKAQATEIKGLVQVKKLLTNTLFNRMLTLETSQLGDLSNPDRRETVRSLIAPLVEEAIKAKDHPLFTAEMKQQFFQGVEVAYQAFEEQGHGDSIQPMVRQLREAFGIPEVKKKVVQQQPLPETPQPKQREVSSSFANAMARFSIQEVEEPSPIIRRSSPVREMTLEERKVKAHAKIQEMIARLDPQCVSFKSDVQDIIREIGFVKKKYPEGTTTDFAQLEKAMQLLLDPSELAVSGGEEKMINKLSSQHGIGSVRLQGYKTTTEARSLREAQVSVIKQLRGETGSLEELNALAGEATNEIRVKTIRARFQSFISVNPLTPPLKGHIVEHFPNLVLMLENFSDTYALTKVNETWEMIRELYDGNTGGEFSRVLATYSYMNPDALIPEVLKDAQNAFLKGVDFKAVDRQERIGFKAYMEQIIEREVGSLPVELFERDYKHLFARQHTWLADNLKYIKVTYNQGDETNTNLGEGVCGSNSLNRVGILAHNPGAPIEALKMGSTQKTRLHQTRTKHYFLAAKNREVTYDYAIEQQTGQSVHFGIKLKNKVPVEDKTGNIHKDLINQMFENVKRGETSFMIGMQKPGAGHAVNVQIDEARGIYRLMDDNIGLVEYPDAKTFKNELYKYFRMNYMSYNQFNFYNFKAV